jgi:hypothetical protein
MVAMAIFIPFIIYDEGGMELDVIIPRGEGDFLHAGPRRVWIKAIFDFVAETIVGLNTSRLIACTVNPAGSIVRCPGPRHQDGKQD